MAQDRLYWRSIGDLISNNPSLSPSPINVSTLVGFWHGQDTFVLHKAQLLCRDSLMGLAMGRIIGLKVPRPVISIISSWPPSPVTLASFHLLL